MKFKRFLTACLLVFCSVASFLGITLVHAQTAEGNSPGGGLQITPAITQIMLQPDQDTLPLVYTATNLTNEAITVVLGTRDFGAYSQSGSITLFGSGYNPATNPHGIQSQITFAAPTITIAAHSSQKIIATIHDTKKLAPGGHYGAILFSPQNTFSSTNSNHVNLSTSIAGLVFLTTAHGGTYGVNVSMSHINHILFNIPNNVYLVFNNTGNTQTIPQGQLTLLDAHAKIVSTQVVNPSSGMVLSGGSRIFQVQLPLQSKWYALPGLYHLKLQYKDSQDTHFKTLNRTFLYINWRVTVLALLLVVLIIYLTNKVIWKVLKRLTYFRIRRRNLKSISHPSASNKTVSLTSPKIMDVARPKKIKQ